ncbi:MAG: 3-phosphoshikimate 1-carboxyvinyltransferase [Chloroflexi bacterium]|nr:MAG: 3-phosphoshikimate 1-carboxyvinyltransferase [Chloroflexota bacterium]MBL1193454.1 3-phosphoshikimate 1-carboxyvinyltransferase [Chloroflexota bacterium]NOH10745.1 3-phosphoshikimate 1-carboxyvinyltransferase [Chloroflexota bacterium]
MKLSISTNKQLRGDVQLPGDKSLSHRSALFAALAKGQSVIDNFLVAGVTETMLDCLTQLGVQWVLEDTRLKVEGIGLKGFASPKEALNCNHSGTTMRLLAGAMVGTDTTSVLDGSDGLRRRPMGRVVDPLRLLGADIQATGEGTAPLHVTALNGGSSLNGMRYELPVASAQVKSAILLAALGANSPTTLTEPSLSRDHTERLLSSMGVDVQVNHSNFEVILSPPVEPLNPLNMSLPGDISSAAFIIVAALITPGSEVTLLDVGLNPTRTGLLDVLQQMGADIQVDVKAERHNEAVGDVTIRSSPLSGVEVGGDVVVRMIDEFPVFGIAAAYASGTTRVRDAEELRYKESDRVTTLCNGLKHFGVDVQEHPDGFTVQGGAALRGGEIDAGKDHRLGMSLSLLGLLTDGPISVSGAEIIQQSFPDFGTVLEQLGAQVNWS